ncbi:MAG: hypothetical protein EOP50_12590, partial [Sphingobacteriales bacterium]
MSNQQQTPAEIKMLAENIRAAFREHGHLVENYNAIPHNRINNPADWQTIAEAEEALQKLEKFAASQLSATALIERVRKILAAIYGPQDCGCSPICRCKSVAGLEATIDGLKGLAEEADA